MNFVKVYQHLEDKEKARVCLHLDGYWHSVDHIANLVHELESDFGYCAPEYIEINVYGGDRIKGYMGIEFDVDPSHPALANYTKVSYLEPTLH